MPRTTRAALRAQELAEEATTAASIALPPTSIKDRVPLGEISNNATVNAEIAMDEGALDAEQKPTTKSKKGKGGKKGKKGNEAKPKKGDVEILEDDNQSSQSDAVEQACTDLMNDDVPESPDGAVPDSDQLPPSPAAEAASAQVSPNNIPISSTSLTEHTDAHDITDEPNVELSDKIENQSKTLNDTEKQANDQEDSFIEQIKTRTPAKRISRIEDSVEALDAFEDEIEKVGEAIPATASNRSSPLEVKKKAKHSEGPKGKGSKTPARTAGVSTKDTKSRITAKNPRPGNRQPKSQQNLTNSKSATQSTAASTSSDPASARKPGFSGVNVPSRAPKRVSSINKAPFQPVKSTKPPTKSSFELPGEAVARKLKEQREERQKREEGEQAKNKAFKAKPPRLSQAPEVKLTTAAKARLSLAQNASKENVKPTPASRLGSKPATASNKRSSTISAPQKTVPQTARKVSPSAPNTAAKRGPSLSTSRLSRQPSTSSSPRAAPTAVEIAQQKLKGKDAYQRTRGLLPEKEKEKKAKEEAAKKARVDAAERGRIASREWAEKQKAQKVAAQQAKTSEESGVPAS